MKRGRDRAVGVVALAFAIAWATAGWRATSDSGRGRTAALVSALGRHGLRADPAGVVWLAMPPLSLVGAVTRTVPVVVRASTAPREAHDIYLVAARLSPEGVLLGVGAAHNLTETSAVDEQRPVGAPGAFAFTERSLLTAGGVSSFRLVQLAAAAAGGDRGGTLDRVQLALSRWQQTGRLSGVRRYRYQVEPAPRALSLRLRAGRLLVVADDKRADISLEQPAEVPAWLSVERVAESRPGNLVTWAVDRVRAEIGDEAMQYVKAIAFSALDWVLSGKERLTGDDGAEAIASDLGEAELEPPTRQQPVDPDIGFPPPALAPWVHPPLPGEGVWHPKDDDPFIHTLPGLPSTFVTTFIRGDRHRQATRVYIALWDPRMVRLNMMAGLAEPKSATGATGPGLIPREPAVMRRLAAAMNAGFQALHGEYGMMSDGVIYLPPKPYSATVALMRDGSNAFGTWPLATAIPPGMLSYRQNMTPMVLDGRFNPYGRTWWGGTPADWEDKTHTVRTGICLTKESFMGYFYGADLSPAALGRAMIQARCSYGIALDMNAGHSGLEFYKAAPAAELGPVGRPLRRAWEREGKVRGMDGWKFRARRLIRGMGLMYFPRYIGREGRDFFYLTLRSVLPGRPLAPAADGPAQQGDGQWRVKGLPQRGFPYAMALSELSLSTVARVRVLKLDPRMLQRAEPRLGRAAEAPTVLAISPIGEPAEGVLSLWFSPQAFSVAGRPPVPGAVRLASATAADGKPAVAAVGVQDEEGMVVYAELVGAGSERATAAAGDALAALIRAAGCSATMRLAAPWPILLGGDSDLELAAARLPAGGEVVRLVRSRVLGASRMFADTPVVPFRQWYPLQSHRIRYFKKRKADAGAADP